MGKGERKATNLSTRAQIYTQELLNPSPAARKPAKRTQKIIFITNNLLVGLGTGGRRVKGGGGKREVQCFTWPPYANSKPVNITTAVNCMPTQEQQSSVKYAAAKTLLVCTESGGARLSNFSFDHSVKPAVSEIDRPSSFSTRLVEGDE